MDLGTDEEEGHKADGARGCAGHVQMDCNITHVCFSVGDILSHGTHTHRRDNGDNDADDSGKAGRGIMFGKSKVFSGEQFHIRVDSLLTPKLGFSQKLAYKNF